MRKLYIVRLTKQERVELQSVVKKLKGTGQKVRRAQLLLKADANGPNWIDERIAEAAQLLDIEPLLDRKPKDLSGGQRQRVAMGRAIVREPLVFLMGKDGEYLTHFAYGTPAAKMAETLRRYL